MLALEDLVGSRSWKKWVVFGSQINACAEFFLPLISVIWFWPIASTVVNLRDTSWRHVSIFWIALNSIALYLIKQVRTANVRIQLFAIRNQTICRRWSERWNHGGNPSQRPRYIRIRGELGKDSGKSTVYEETKGSWRSWRGAACVSYPLLWFVQFSNCSCIAMYSSPAVEAPPTTMSEGAPSDHPPGYDAWWSWVYLLTISLSCICLYQDKSRSDHVFYLWIPWSAALRQIMLYDATRSTGSFRSWHPLVVANFMMT